MADESLPVGSTQAVLRMLCMFSSVILTYSRLGTESH